MHESVSILGGLLAVVCAWLLLRRDSAPSGAGAGMARWEIHGVWIAAALKLAYLIQTILAGHVTQWPDDSCRFFIALSFNQRIAFEFGNHVWPGGPFVLTGLLMRLAQDPTMALRWQALFFGVAGVWAAAYAARQAVQRDGAAIGAALIVAALPMHTWLSAGAMSETPMACFIMASLGLGLDGWRRFAGNRPGGAWRVLAAGLMATLASSYRYEGWIFIFVFGTAAIGRLLWIRLGRPDRPARWGLYRASVAGALALSLLFPLFWMSSSLYWLGDPLGFFDNQTSLNTVGVREPLVERLLYLPRSMDLQMGTMWGLLGGGLAVSALSWRRLPVLSFAAAVLCGYLGVIIAMTVAKGMGESQERYVVSMIVAASPLAGAALAIALEAWKVARGALRVIPMAAAGFCAASLIFFAVHSAGRMDKYKWYGFANESFVAGNLLVQEFHEPQLLPGLGRGGRVLVWKPDGRDLEHLWHIKLMAAHPDRILFAGEAEFPAFMADEANLAVLQFGSKDTFPPPRFEKIGEIGSLQVFR